MRLSRTAPQPVVPEEPSTGVWQTGPQGTAGYQTGPQGTAGYSDGYTGTFDTSAFDFDRPDSRDRVRDTAAFERPDGFPGQDDDRYGADADDRGRRGGGHRAGRRRYDDGDGDDDGYGRPTRRRWPIVTGALALLVVLVGGGLYGFWRYNQSQYYVGVTPDGYVSIFRGTDQSLAGISLSSLISRSTLKASLLTSGDQATLQQTITASSVNDAQLRIDQLQGQVTQCQQTYQTLATWKIKNAAYQAYLTAKTQATAHHGKAPAVVANPGLMPTQLPGADQCAPSTAFGILASALPAAGTTTGTPAAATPSATPARTPTTTSSTKATPTPSVRTTPTAAG